MKMLSGEEMDFFAQDSGVQDTVVRNRCLAMYMAPEKLTLKKGAQVMLIKNIDNTLVNGSLGMVQAFMDESTFSIYSNDEESFMAAQNGNGDPEDEGVAKAKKKIQSAMNGAPPGKRWPLVKFNLADGTSRTLLCQPEDWKSEAPNGEIIAKRLQVPLILAWALSIHKAQGQTIERVKVDLGKVFEKGQAYVALSRATSQGGLQVLRFDPKKVMVHPKVIQFYNNLVGAHTIVGEGSNTARRGSLDGMPQAFADFDDDDHEEESRYMYA